MNIKLHHIHPFLFALAPAIFLWGNNFAEVFPREIMPVFLLLIVFAAVTYGICFLVMRHAEKAALLASAVITFAVAYNHIFFNTLTLSFIRQRYALLIIVICCFALAYMLWRTKADLSGPTRIATAGVGAFILMSLIPVVFNLYDGQRSSSSQVDINDSGEVDTKRDVYYIVLDEYEAPSVLRDKFGFNGAYTLVNFLEEKGFFVADEAKSNYDGTSLSLSSSLNLRYLTPEEMDNPLLRTHLADDHLLKDFFKEQGYQYIHFGADTFTFYNSHADENINIGLFSPYQRAVLEATIFTPLLRSFGQGGWSVLSEYMGVFDRRKDQYQRTLFKLEQLTTIPTREEPTFVFAHFLTPHRPYVFHPDGTFVTREERTIGREVDFYLGQIEFINREIKELVQHLLDTSELDPIIVIQADHGYRGAELYTFAEPEQRVRILSTYYVPTMPASDLYESISPVNSFRVILNHYFAQELELLEDRSYITGTDDPSRVMEGL